MSFPLARFAFLLARSRLGEKIIRWSFAHMVPWMPVEKLVENPQVVAFYHPRPAYPVHILIVPKKEIRSLAAVEPADSAILVAVLQTAQELVRRLGLERQGYRLIVNGGAYQDIQQIHFHLISGD